ncbi:MAG: hypothetical protein V4541_13790 [Bacteroidota bacterium]
MKSIVYWLLMVLAPGIALSQTKINKLYPVNNAKEIEFHFDYPKLIHVTSWDRNEISIAATVRINGEENDKVFTLEQSNSGDKITIVNKLALDQIPETFYVVDKGIKTRFATKGDLQVYLNGKDNTMLSTYQQKDIEITIEIKVPANANTLLVSTYGMVEIENLKGPIKVDAIYGGVDASLNEKAIGKILLTNRYGKIYTNLDLQPIEKKEQNFFTSIMATPGIGANYEFNSSYGNIYLRNSGK